MANPAEVSRLEYLEAKVKRLEAEKALAIECWQSEEALRVYAEEQLKEMQAKTEWLQQNKGRWQCANGHFWMWSKEHDRLQCRDCGWVDPTAYKSKPTWLNNPSTMS